ncbi:hypothetical protein ARV3_gp33 [Acidianus rod-shaped virus 3]|uniref:Uncharacterized protein n=1 Tax=Acidianus rod-shaped virus 3 TaxID=2730617 RepID=A0A6M3VXU8_9VIRU|nr:hypothetical protein QIT28_gp33 [Acidianus rod-shaped virus 3]QJF12346.1 hypothetical protein ARV3_gp33 [Acidianus rod-shaped virus 3]
MEILRFANEKEYKEWLKHQSASVAEKAMRFAKKYPGVLPIIIIADVDTCHQCLDGVSHLFLPPYLGAILDQVID